MLNLKFNLSIALYHLGAQPLRQVVDYSFCKRYSSSRRPNANIYSDVDALSNRWQIASLIKALEDGRIDHHLKKIMGDWQVTGKVRLDSPDDALFNSCPIVGECLVLRKIQKSANS